MSDMPSRQIERGFPVPPIGQIGVKFFPFYVDEPGSVFSFDETELLPGVFLRRLQDNNLGELQATWNWWTEQEGAGIVGKWIRPNMMVVVDGAQYVPDLFRRTASWWPNLQTRKPELDPDGYENAHVVAIYPVQRHLITSILLLRGCSLGLLDGGFQLTKDWNGNLLGGSISRILPLQNRSRDIRRSMTQDQVSPITAIELCELFRSVEIYYAPIRSSYDRISVALGAHWNFITATAPDTAFLSLVTMIEALVGPNDGETITHQISERIALLLGSCAEERIELYRSVKQIYNERSKFIHGKADFKKGRIDWSRSFVSAQISTVDDQKYIKLINITTRIMKFCITNDEYKNIIEEKDEKDLTEYFLRRSMSLGNREVRKNIT